MDVYEVRPRNDHRGVAEKSALEKEQYPFSRLGIMNVEHPTNAGDEEPRTGVP
jgi:hypothetical protein